MASRDVEGGETREEGKREEGGELGSTLSLFCFSPFLEACYITLESVLIERTYFNQGKSEFVIPGSVHSLS